MSILRRVHTANFTIVGNAMLNDVALSAEALGMICYLLGKPHNWVLRPGELADRFDCGDDRTRRIIKELIDAGYIRKVRARDPATQQWGPVEYIVMDTKAEPLPENTDVAPDQPENPPLENPPLAFTPPTKNIDKKTDSKKSISRKVRKQIAYSDEFERDIWAPYQRKDGTSKANAFKKYQACTPEDQERIKATIPIYWRMAERAKFDHHLEFFISRRIFETIPLATTVTVLQGGAPAPIDRSTWETFARIYANNSRWNPAWGPEPGHPRCQMPLDLQQQFVNGGLTH